MTLHLDQNQEGWLMSDQDNQAVCSIYFSNQGCHLVKEVQELLMHKAMKDIQTSIRINEVV